MCSLLTAVGLYWLGGLQPGASPVVAFAAATVFGIGKSYFWPTMLGVTAEQFPTGGALLLSLMGGAGMLSVAIAIPMMGARMDQFGPGAALQYVAMLGCDSRPCLRFDGGVFRDQRRLSARAADRAPRDW